MDEPKLEDMTLRDLMAMFAMMGLVSGTTMWSHDADDTGISGGAYAIADAMIEERSKQ